MAIYTVGKCVWIQHFSFIFWYHICLCLKLGAYYAMELKIVNFFPQIANVFRAWNLMTKATGLEKQKTQARNKNKMLFLDTAYQCIHTKNLILGIF